MKISAKFSVVLALVCAAGIAHAQQIEEVIGADFSIINQQLAEAGESVVMITAETIAVPGSSANGATVFAKDVGNQRMFSHFVNGDPNRDGASYISYTVDTVDASVHLPIDQTTAAIDAAMGTWGSQDCSNLDVPKFVYPGYDLGYVQYLLGFGGFPGWGADITHAGWLPGDFFEYLEPGGSEFILGVTFTFIWIDENGNPTDMDNNGQADTAFREIYYNDAFAWSVEAPGPLDPEFDVETIALHEAGHGFSQGHFGKIFFDGRGGSLRHLHFAPLAVMNAMAWGTKRELLTTDMGGHCDIWAAW